MKKLLKIGLLLLLVLAFTLSSVILGSSATSYTWTINSKGRFAKTQDAYLPQLALIELGLSGPEDLYVDSQDHLYIADTGNSRVLKYSIKSNTVIGTYEDSEMKTPKGIFVTEDGLLYVADSKSEKILVFDTDYKLIESFSKPTDVAYGDTPFKPVRVAVDTKKNMYVIGEGVLNGIIHLSNGGKFLGYYASNKVTLNLLQSLQDRFFTDAQLDNLGSRVPITMTNLFVDQKNIVYSTTIGTAITKHLAKHNTAGANIFSDHMYTSSNLIDVYVDHKGIIYAADLDGLIWVYSNDGAIIHVFGGTHKKEDVSGLFSRLASIAIDSKGNIWAADSETSYVQSFAPTDYALLIYEALEDFNKGRYEEAEGLWTEILSKNQMLTLAHNGLGKVYLYTERYEEAMKHLKIANSKYFYSQAFWEVRNEWLQKNLSSFIIGIILIMIAWSILKWVDKKKFIFDGFRRLYKQIRKIKWMDDLLFLFDFIKHPIDSFYDLKINARGSYVSTTIIYALIFLSYMLSRVSNSFLFQEQMIEDIDLNALILGFFVITLLFIITNYLVSSIQEGDGKLGTIYKMTVHALSPFMYSLLLNVMLSYILTYNEVFIMEIITLVGIVWSLILVLIGLQEIHNYTTGVAIKSILFSLGFMIILAIIILIVILMGEQVYDFFEAIVREVIRNVKN